MSGKRQRVTNSPDKRNHLFQLPPELLIEIFGHLPVYAWRHSEPTHDLSIRVPVHSVRATCRLFRDLLDERVSELWILNSSPFLSMDALCKKIARCQRNLRRLTLYHVHLGNTRALQQLTSVINQCTKLTELRLTPGCGGTLRMFDPSAMQHVTTIRLIPNDDSFSAIQYMVIPTGDWNELWETSTVPTPSARDGSRDSAISCYPTRTDIVARGIRGTAVCQLESMRTSQKFYVPTLWYPPEPTPIDPGRYWLCFSEFSCIVWWPVDELNRIETVTPNGVAVCLTQPTGPSTQVPQIYYVSRIRNIVASTRVLMSPWFQAIHVAISHTVTLWVRPQDLTIARQQLPPGMALAPLWDIHVDHTSRMQFVTPLQSIPLPHP